MGLHAAKPPVNDGALLIRKKTNVTFSRYYTIDCVECTMGVHKNVYSPAPDTSRTKR